MPLTRDFRETVQARAARDPAFREAMFQEAVEALLQGDVDDGRRPDGRVDHDGGAA